MQYLCSQPHKFSIGLPDPTYDVEVEEEGANKRNYKHYEQHWQPENQSYLQRWCMAHNSISPKKKFKPAGLLVYGLNQ